MIYDKYFIKNFKEKNYKMFFVVFFLISVFDNFTCLFDEVAGSSQPVGFRNTNRAVNNLEENRIRRPIRITFDYSLLYPSATDAMRCDKVGQKVQWGDTRRYDIECKKEQILNSAGIDVVVKTINNVKTYVERLISIDNYNDPINSRSIPQYITVPRKTYTDTDLVFHVASRPFDDPYYSLCILDQYDSTNGRPIENAILINPELVPTTAQNETMRESSYFFAILHEITHGLGFNHFYYDKFHPRDSLTPYEQPTCTMIIHKIKRSFLVTPHAHKYAVRHYKVEKFKGDDGAECPSGIELEDAGTDFQIGSHLEARVFYSEFMISLLIQSDVEPFHRFTDATLAILLDTGNYDINYRMLKPIIWGNRDAFAPDSDELNDFALGPPQLAFPSNYIVENPIGLFDTCNFDFKSTGRNVKSVPVPDCTADTSDFCRAEDYYNPKRMPMYNPNKIFDYMLYKYPHTCFDGYAAIPGSLGCIKYWLTDTNVKFELPKDIRFDSQNITCSNKDFNPEKWINYTYIDQKGKKLYKRYMCPPFERFKRTIQLFNSYFDSDPFDLDTPQKYKVMPDNIEISNESPREELPTISVPVNTGNSTSINSKDYNFLGTGLPKSTFIGVSTTALLVIVVCFTLCFVGRRLFKQTIEAVSDKGNDLAPNARKHSKRKRIKRSARSSRLLTSDGGANNDDEEKAMELNSDEVVDNNENEELNTKPDETKSKDSNENKQKSSSSGQKKVKKVRRVKKRKE